MNFPLPCLLFFPPVWPFALGTVLTIEKKDTCGPKTLANHHINTSQTTKTRKNTTKNDPQIPQPDLRFAKKQNSEATKNGAGPKQKPIQTFSDLPRKHAN